MQRKVIKEACKDETLPPFRRQLNILAKRSPGLFTALPSAILALGYASIYAGYTKYSQSKQAPQEEMASECEEKGAPRNTF